MPDPKLKAGINFTDKISDRTFNFTGREWVFQAIHQWISDPNGSRYFLLTGEPGAGKTAISDRLTQFSSSPEPLPKSTPWLSQRHSPLFCPRQHHRRSQTLCAIDRPATRSANTRICSSSERHR